MVPSGNQAPHDASSWSRRGGFAPTCVTVNADTAWAAMKFSRLKENGEPLPPTIRASSYTLAKFPEGWRITKVGAGGVSPEQPITCPAPTAP